jgi:transposase InsO family protein
MSRNNFLKLNIKEFIINNKITTKLMSIHSKNIPAIGICNLKCYYKNQLEFLLFYIVDFECTTILGLPTCSKFNLIKRINCVNENPDNLFVNKFSDIFEGLGCLPFKCHIHINPNVQPIIDAPRKIPFALYDQLGEELNNMCKTNVIEKVTTPTSWVSSIVLVIKKNKKLRICLDPRNLNKAIQRSHYPLPTFEVIKTQLSNAKVFSTLDANSGFWMIPLDEESSNLCTFNTPFGRYKFCRLPYGLSCAPEIFHRIMSELFSHIDGVIVYIDDIIVIGSNQEEHDIRLKKVFNRAREVNLKLNKDKCNFGANEVKFLGHIFNGQGVKPDNDKVRAIVDMPSPKSVKDLQRFLGMLNYLSSYIPNLADETATLRLLLKKDSAWLWDENYETIFSKVKQCITTSPVLAYFNPLLPITLSVDASQFAVGAVIMQNDKPCAYASQSLNTTQQNYAQIEKELYAIVFGCQRFHQYLYGQTVKVQTDHKPLVSLFKKPLHSVPTRLQRMMLKIQSYDLIVDYVPGKLLVLADTLSRAPLSDINKENIDEELILHVQAFTDNLAVEKTQLEKIRKETSNDTVLSKILDIYLVGWPTDRNKIEDCLKPYWTFRDEIHIIDDLVFKGNCLVIPQSLRSEMLNLIHEGHMGIERCRNQVKNVLFWPNITNDIKNTVESCEICIKYRKNNVREPMISHPIPDLPWQKLGVDFFYYNNKTYLLVADYFSKYVEIALLANGFSAKLVISQLKSIFSRFGIPLKLISDNGPPFNSQEFKLFTNDWGVQHITTSPNYPQSNGLAERSIQTVKKLLKKSMDAGKDPYIALMQYRNTPKGKLCSPSQLLMSRSLRTKLPILSTSLKPNIIDLNNYKNQISLNNNRTELYYNKKSKQLSSMQVNDKILFKVKPEGNWTPGVIVDICNQPRSYEIKTENGQKYRRNRRHIIKSAIKNNNINFNKNKPDTVNKEVVLVSPPTVIEQPKTRNKIGRKIVKPKRYLNN